MNIDSKKIIALTVVINILLIGLGIVELFRGGIEEERSIAKESNYPVGEALSKEFKVRSKGLLSKDAGKTTWSINGVNIGTGKTIRLKNVNYLKEGENELVAELGNDRVKYKLHIAKGVETDDKTQNRVNLLDPVEAQFVDEWSRFTDTDNDGVSDQDEVEKYGTDPYSDYSNNQGVSDLQYAITVEGEIDGKETPVVEIDGARIQSESGNIENTLKMTVSEVYNKQLEGKEAVAVGGLDGKDNAILTLTDVGVGQYIEPKIARYSPNGDIEIIERSGYNEEIGGIYAILNKNGIYFVIDHIKHEEQSIEDLVYTEIAIVLDDSGSMYDAEQWIEGGNDREDIPKDGIGKDVEFKRVSFMTDLIDALDKEERQGNGRYRYSVAAFTADYFQLSEMGDAEESKNAVESIKTGKKEFNGNKFEKAISYSRDTFTEDSMGSKVIICLTDGESTSGGLLDIDIDQMVAQLNIGSDLKRQGIDLILIGLGADTGRENLQKLADDSGGMLLNAKDADALDTLLGRIVKRVRVGGTEDIKIKTSEDEEVTRDVTIIADSGFDPSVDGFNFENFSTTTSEGGNCFGFSITAKMIYEGYNEENQFWRLGESPIHDRISGAFSKLIGRGNKVINASLTEKALNSLKKGRTYNVKVDADKIFNLTGPSLPKEYKNGHLSFTKEGSKKAIDNGYKILTDEKYNKEVDGKYVDRYDYIVLDPLSPNAIKKDPDGLSVVRLIARGQQSQTEGLLKTLGSNDKEKVEFNSTLRPIIDTMNRGEPSMVSISCSLGGNSVLGTKLSQDNVNPNRYYLHIYDSNEPGKDMVSILELKNIIKDGKLESRYYFNYFTDGLNFNKIGYRKEVKVYEGRTNNEDYSPTGKNNNNTGLFYYTKQD